MMNDQLFSTEYIEYARKAMEMLETFQLYFHLNDLLWKRYSQGLFMPSMIKINPDDVFISDTGCQDMVFPTTIIDSAFSRKTTGMFHVMDPKILQHKTIQMLMVMLYLQDNNDEDAVNQLDSFQISSLLSLHVKLFGERNIDKLIIMSDDNIITLQFRRPSDTFCELNLNTLEKYIKYHIKTVEQWKDLYDRHRYTLSLRHKMEIYKHGPQCGYDANVLKSMFKDIIQECIISNDQYFMMEILKIAPSGFDIKNEIYIVPMFKKFNMKEIYNFDRASVNINNIRIAYVYHNNHGSMVKHINLLAYELLKDEPDLELIYHLMKFIDINQTTHDDEHIIFTLYDKKKMAILQYLFQHTNINIHATDKGKKTCFYYACKENNVLMMELFKEHGAVVDFDVNEMIPDVRAKLHQMEIMHKMSKLNV